MRIKDVEYFYLDVPFHPVPDRNMSRAQHGWHIVEICRLTTDNGFVGIGETLPNYTWSRTSKESYDRIKGRNPFELLYEDNLGAGIQMAILDLCGKAAEVPAWRLLGKKVRDWCPISWWGIDMSPEDYASETRDAVSAGYTSFKQKARPWWDVYEQARLTVAEADINFKLDFDFNEHLVNAANAIPVLQELDKFPQIAIYESPIPQGDVEGNKRIRAAIRGAVAMHYAHPPMGTAIREQCTDGWVVCAGINGVLRAARLCEQVHMPFWLQQVGTGITTTFAAHLGAVCQQAIWPAVTCMNMYVDQLITKPIEVRGGFYRVPEAPGLGIEFNEAALKWKVDSSTKPPLDQRNGKALYAICYTSGERVWYKGEMIPNGYWPDCAIGNQPICEHGVRLETWANDGSKEWSALAAKVADGPVRDCERPV